MNAIINKTEFKIGVTPVVLYGDNSDKLFIFVHGQGGNKYEGERFFNVAKQFSYQVLAVDLPGHGERSDGEDFVPWKVSSLNGYSITLNNGGRIFHLEQQV